ncbi:hypothetical protein DM068_16095 [Klebsiella pneumoniae]|nr:hypothetical protein DM068_16095 [Klebsiella pneumoniae]
MGSCAAPSAKGDDKFITTDYLQQCPVLRVSGRTRPVTGDTTPYDQRPAELHNPRITQATYMSIWESAHLAGLRNCIGLDYPFAFYLVTVCRLLDHHQLNLSH